MKNIYWHKGDVTRKMRENLAGHRSAAIWFTGLSGSGKSTLAHALESKLVAAGFKAYVMDGDNIRHGLCVDLGFSNKDRKENVRRIGEVCKLFVDAGIIVISAFISPIRADREWVREKITNKDFIEVYCQCSLEECERRDVKGIYKLARKGEIPEFTGISSPYEEPVNPDIVINTESVDVDSAVSKLLSILCERGTIKLDF